MFKNEIPYNVNFAEKGVLMKTLFYKNNVRVEVYAELGIRAAGFIPRVEIRRGYDLLGTIWYGDTPEAGVYTRMSRLMGYKYLWLMQDLYETYPEKLTVE